MSTKEVKVEPGDDPKTEFEPITTDSGVTLRTQREAILWNAGFTEGFVQAQEGHQLGDDSRHLPGVSRARLELGKIRSIHPDFKPPTRNNGEELVPSSVRVRGEYIVVRYFGWEPISGPAIDRFFLDVFYNSEGREVVRVNVKVLLEPPTPTFFERLRDAIYVMLGPSSESLRNA